MTWQELETYIREAADNVGTATREKVTGVNFVTPDIVTTRKMAGHLIEISYGRSFGDDGWLIGLTVCPLASNESSNPSNLVWRSRCVTPEELPAALADMVSALRRAEIGTGAGVS